MASKRPSVLDIGYKTVLKWHLSHVTDVYDYTGMESVFISNIWNSPTKPVSAPGKVTKLLQLPSHSVPGRALFWLTYPEGRSVDYKMRKLHKFISRCNGVKIHYNKLQCWSI